MFDHGTTKLRDTEVLQIIMLMITITKNYESNDDNDKSLSNNNDDN